MAPLTLLALFSASFVFLSKAQEDEGSIPESIELTVKFESEGMCLEEINAARRKAGFSNFTQPASGSEAALPSEENVQLWYPVCLAATPGGTIDTGKFPPGTFAVAPQSSTKVDCDETVDRWKAAYKNFDGPPPGKFASSEVYNNLDNLSLVAMYNPSADASADCRVMTCTQTPKATGDPNVAGQQSGGQAEEKHAYALVCGTMPNALPINGSGPFTYVGSVRALCREEQWDRIAFSFIGSATAVAPSLLAFALVALGMAAAV